MKIQCARCGHICRDEETRCPMCGGKTVPLAEDLRELDKIGLRKLPEDYVDWLTEMPEPIHPKDLLAQYGSIAETARPSSVIPSPETTETVSEMPDPEEQKQFSRLKRRMRQTERHREINLPQVRFAAALICIAGTVVGGFLTWKLIRNVAFPMILFFTLTLIIFSLIVRRFGRIYGCMLATMVLILLLFHAATWIFGVPWDIIGITLSYVWLFLLFTGCCLFLKC